MQAMRAALHLIYPPQCLSCGGLVGSDFGLCPDCWRDAPFCTGLVCDACGTPLPGEDDGTAVHCDDCLTLGRPWRRGRAAMLYSGTGRKLVLAMKHADRTDLARPAADWLMRAAGPILQPDMLVAPVPLHWWRLFRRRYNQAALLSAGLARRAALDHCPDLLARARHTGSQDGRGRDGRFANVQGVFRVPQRHRARIAGRHVLLVDDVMTSGATLAACAEAALSAGARAVSVCVMARVAKDA